MELGLTVELGLLLDTYGTLLTEKMKNILSMYVEENMTLQEIADYYEISKPAVLDSLNKAQKKLQDIEKKVKMLYLKKQVKAIIQEDKNIKEKLQKLIEEV